MCRWAVDVQVWAADIARRPNRSLADGVVTLGEVVRCVLLARSDLGERVADIGCLDLVSDDRLEVVRHKPGELLPSASLRDGDVEGVFAAALGRSAVAVS